MQVTTKGLIIREQTVGEHDRLVTVLTQNEGVLRAFAHRAKNLKDSKSAATGLLTYSRLSIYKGRDTYSINDAAPIEVFFGLRNDIGSLCLAQYFCELSAFLVPEETDSADYLRLVLNSLHFLSKNTRPPLLVKATTELRMLSLAGYMPDLLCCRGCACYEHAHWGFYPRQAAIYCKDCAPHTAEPYVPLNQGVLTALRHIIYADFQKLYAFSLPPEGLTLLAKATETYAVHTLGKRLPTLDFYYSVT